MLEESSASCETTLGEDSWKLAFEFLQTSSDVLFPFANFALYPFDVINQENKDVRGL